MSAAVTREDLRRAFAITNVYAFSHVVRGSESSHDPIGYRMRFGGHGKPVAYFDDLSRHPKIFEPTRDGQRSSAAGAYQATWTTWSEEQARYKWPDFSEDSQDEFFVARLVYRKALDAVIAGRFAEACRLCKNEWTSLPGGPEENTLTARARDTYIKWGGTFGTSDEVAAPPTPTPRPQPAPTPSKGWSMAPLIPIVLEGLAALIPALGKLGFGSGSEVAQRNVTAGAIVADKLVEVTKAVNLQEAAERIQNDPAALEAARQAVAEVVFEIAEAGGGGIEGARNAAKLPDGDWRKVVFTGPFILAGAMLPLVYAVVFAALLKLDWLAEITSEVRTGVITSVTGLILGSLMGYFFGTSASSSRKDSLLAGKP